jgi:hypothetical protein
LITTLHHSGSVSGNTVGVTVGASLREAVSAAVLISVSVGLTACSSSSATINYQKLQGQYQAASAPANAAIQTFGQQVARLGANPSARDLEAAAQPLLAALQLADRQILALPVPASMSAHVQALVAAEQVVETDLKGFGASTSATSQVISKFADDAGKERSAANALRADLHLPPLTA